MDSFQIIGIDGGATKVSAWEIEYNGSTFSLGQAHYAEQYINQNFFNSSFTPVNIQTQLSEMNMNNIQLTGNEIKQGVVIIQTFATVINRIFQINLYYLVWVCLA